jgi:hypothetical protein
MKKFSVLSSAALFALAGVSHAAVQDTFTWTTPFVPPQASAASSGLIVAPNTITNTGNPYTLRRITISGSITETGTSNDFISDNEVQVSIPGFSPFTFDLSAATGYTGTTAFTGTHFPSTTITSPFTGTPTFSFANTFDDSPTGTDAIINNLTLTFRDDFPAPTGTITDLGVLANTSSNYSVADYSTSVTLSPTTTVSWVKFTLPAGVSSSAGQFLDIDMAGPSGADTVIGLYRAFNAGVLVTSDDDDGIDSFSALSFGQATPARGPIGNGLAGNARDGTSLSAGDYYLAVANYAAGFGFAAGYAVTGIATPAAPVTYTINLRTNVPEPTTLAVVAGAGLLALRRRR